MSEIDPWSLHCGDSVQVLKTLPDASLDSIVTDPPYGLSEHDTTDVMAALTAWMKGEEYVHDSPGFMGKDWDAFVPGPAVWKECFRVLKPGGHLLAFSGSRTLDLMGMSIRLAGFEIRDGIAWMHGQGFPKGLDVSKAMDKTWRGQREEVLRVTGWIRDRRNALGLSNKDLEAACGTVGMASHWTSQKSQPAIPTTDMWAKLEPLLGPAPDWMVPHIKPPREPRGAWAQREVIGRKTNGSTSIVGMGSRPTMKVEYDITAPASDEAKEWDGWSTALKPSFEPVVVARKPLEGTVAANIMTHRTGAFNIDGCRVRYESTPNPTTNPLYRKEAGYKNVNSPDQNSSSFALKDGSGERNPNSGGRWPPNVILGHGEDCVCVGTRVVSTGVATESEGDHEIYGTTVKSLGRKVTYRDNGSPNETIESWECMEGCPVYELDLQSGIQRSGTAVKRNGVSTTRDFGGNIGHFPVGSADAGYGDIGGASRFFFTPKPTRAERTANGRVVNNHVTVKPLALMRYLCRLVTPPGGTVLDPFMGSGTTGVGAIQEGFKFIGVERDAESCETARGRIALALDDGSWTDPEEIREVSGDAPSLEDMLFGGGNDE